MVKKNLADRNKHVLLTLHLVGMFIHFCQKLHIKDLLNKQFVFIRIVDSSDVIKCSVFYYKCILKLKIKYAERQCFVSVTYNKYCAKSNLKF